MTHELLSLAAHFALSFWINFSSYWSFADTWREENWIISWIIWCENRKIIEHWDPSGNADIFIHTEKFENFRIRITSKVACGIIQPTLLWEFARLACWCTWEWYLTKIGSVGWCRIRESELLVRCAGKAVDLRLKWMLLAVFTCQRATFATGIFCQQMTSERVFNTWMKLFNDLWMR